uniref:Phasin protein n=1 Tax=Candidatus Kentrum sp. MB TaxID=2138164 RepID=A0A450XAA2_9GAMM|nr:MAG: Phasin protein [Candidatus Kentron sp. MB]VFK30793.1 MAG: Phasin protein [Candidatus Kentron sp. MB]VFK75234.1 MAG: Phasin protein [Candidatus Kentron sp. MB]
MATQKDETTSKKKSVDEMQVQKAEETLVKKAVSPLERWTMVAEAAYYRAQKRGFVGGNPMEDWMEAEKEIDAEYTIDYSKIMTLLNPLEMMDQLGKIFGGGARTELRLDEILENQRKNIEALTNANKRVFQDAKEMMDRQTEMFKKIMDQAIISPVKGKSAKSASSKAAIQQAELIRLGVEKGLISMRETAESIVKANAEAFDAANQRMAESMSTFRQLIQKIKLDK